MKEFKVNEFITLRLEQGITNIYVKGKLFNQCRSLLMNIPIARINDYNQINSIDEVVEKLQLSEEEDIQNIECYEISPEIEFWGHCSNIQAWVENNYDTRLLHRNLSFPLLKELSDLGDLIARAVFKEEIAKRFLSGHTAVMIYLIEQGYLKYLNHNEISIMIEDIVEKADNETLSRLIELGVYDLLSEDLSYFLTSKIIERGDPGIIGSIISHGLLNKELESIIVKNLKNPIFLQKFYHNIKNVNDINLLNDLGKKLIDLDLYAIAVKVFDRLIIIFPNWSRAWNNMGTVYRRLKMYEKSIYAYSKAIEFSGEFSGFQKNVVHAYWSNLGHVYTDINDYKNAIKAYNKVLELNPNDYKALESKGYIYYKKGRYDKAQYYVESSLKIEPNYKYSLTLKGLISEAKGNLNEAEDNYNKALKIDPEFSDAFSYLGSLYGLKGDYNNAINFSKRALEIDKKRDIDYNNIGWFCYKQGKCQNAINYLKQAIDLNPNVAIYLNNLGLVYFLLADYENAIDMFKRVLEINPNALKVQFNLAFAYLQLKSFNEINEICEKIVKARSDDCVINYLKGRISYYKGEYIKAVDYYKKALINCKHILSIENLINFGNVQVPLIEAIFLSEIEAKTRISFVLLKDLDNTHETFLNQFTICNNVIMIIRTFRTLNSKKSMLTFKLTDLLGDTLEKVPDFIEQLNTFTQIIDYVKKNYNLLQRLQIIYKKNNNKKKITSFS